jgi:hypothetical protein
LYDLTVLETREVISSSWVGERRYLTSFLSLNRKSYFEVRNDAALKRAKLPLSQPFLNDHSLTIFLLMK